MAAKYDLLEVNRRFSGYLYEMARHLSKGENFDWCVRDCLHRITNGLNLQGEELEKAARACKQKCLDIVDMNLDACREKLQECQRRCSR